MDAAVAAGSDYATDGPWELPEGWTWMQLGGIVDIHDHRRRPIKSEDRQIRIAGKASSDLFPYYGATGQVGLIDGFLFDFPAILLGEDGAPFLDRQRAKAYAVDGRYWVNNHAHILTPRESAISSWLLHALNFIDYEPHVGGTTRLKLTKAQLERITVPLAPLPEQRRIVARVDALFAEIAEGEAALADARKGLNTFRRALLKAAVSGELTKDWRAANPATETGHDLLVRIANERTGKAAPRGRRRADVSPLDISSLPELPNGWAWAILGDLTISGPTNGYSPKKSADGSGTLALKLTATTKGQIDLTDRAIKSLSETIPPGSDLFLKSGDLLFQRGNTPEYVGIAAVYDGPSDKYVYPDLMIRVRTATSSLTEWIWRVANSPLGRKYMMDKASGTAGTMPKISGEILRNFPVPIPPPAEADEILRRVSDALAAAADTLLMLDAEAADAARLKQSILKAAFQGYLVPQDPTDEPATALLARLAADPPAIRGRRGRARKSDA